VLITDFLLTVSLTVALRINNTLLIMFPLIIFFIYYTPEFAKRKHPSTKKSTGVFKKENIKNQSVTGLLHPATVGDYQIYATLDNTSINPLCGLYKDTLWTLLVKSLNPIQ